jgi:S-adenosylmethionine synthetase
MHHNHYIFNSESVTEGHPDKLCDQISDAIIGHYLVHDPRARVIAECSVTTGLVFVAIKHHSSVTPDASRIARDVIRSVGYIGNGFDAEASTILSSLTEVRDKHLSRVNESQLSEEEIERIVVSDQVTCFGFACNHTPVLMPLPIWLAHKLARQLANVRKAGILPYLSPDGKTQVGVEFKDKKPHRIHSLTLFASQSEEGHPKASKLREDLIQNVIEPAFSDEPISIDNHTRININPHGALISGGPTKHSGLTGRKTAVDTYGGFARQNTAALSGKDPSRIDRVGVYAARYAAKNIVAAGLAEMCEVQLSYSIGISRPVSISVETFGTSQIPDLEIGRRIESLFDFRLGNIVKQFHLRSLPKQLGVDFYKRLSAYGQVGRTDLALPWEVTDRIEILRERHLKMM